MADLRKQKAEPRKINGKVIPMFPSLFRTVHDKEKGLLATCLLSPEEVCRSIEEWREAWPEIANDPKMRAHYDPIYESNKKKLAQG